MDRTQTHCYLWLEWLKQTKGLKLILDLRIASECSQTGKHTHTEMVTHNSQTSMNPQHIPIPIFVPIRMIPIRIATTVVLFPGIQFRMIGGAAGDRLWRIESCRSQMIILIREIVQLGNGEIEMLIIRQITRLHALPNRTGCIHACFPSIDFANQINLTKFIENDGRTRTIVIAIDSTNDENQLLFKMNFSILRCPMHSLDVLRVWKIT